MSPSRHVGRPARRAGWTGAHPTRPAAAAPRPGRDRLLVRQQQDGLPRRPGRRHPDRLDHRGLGGDPRPGRERVPLGSGLGDHRGPAGATSSPATTRATAAAAALQGTAPGTYTSDTSGSVTIGASKQDAAGTQTLTISALRGGTQHSTVHGDQGDTAQDLVVRPTGTYLASLTLTSPAFTKQFRPSPAALLVPDPAKPGAAWSWSATSTDGRTTAEATNRITGTQAVTVGGRPVATAVVQTHLVLSGDLTYTADLTTYWSPQYRLPVKDRTVGKGTYSGIPFATDITSLLRSVTPS
jgi:hypothetical protein